jgi:antirestriction protein ArdC
MNYSSIFAGFTAKGIAIEDIIPRKNVFTFHAWRALGRIVRKGEHGVKACTWIPVSQKDDSDGKGNLIVRDGFKMARTVTVFHVSQTDAMPEVE